MSARPDEPLVRVENLDVTFRIKAAKVSAARAVSFAIRKREVVALVGESGSGKSTIGLSLLGLLAPGVATVSGSIRIVRKSGRSFEIIGARDRQMLHVRGNDIAMIFQEPMSSLNPIYRIGTQIAESLRVHRRVSQRDALVEALRLLTLLGVPSPEKCLQSYPHQLSGGMRQRAMIAMALSGQPALLVADEPTTALDVTIQAQIVDLLKSVQQDTAMAILFVTHDLGLVGEVASRVLVMYAGEIVEEGPVRQILTRPRMPYTKALIASRPHLGGERRKINAIPGTVPDLTMLPAGCSFHPRCAFAVQGLCDRTAPALEEIGEGWRVRCHRWREIEEAGA
jgi:oligopeptide/dipeptide ABC transporter ATP-binding protein